MSDKCTSSMSLKEMQEFCSEFRESIISSFRSDKNLLDKITLESLMLSMIMYTDYMNILSPLIFQDQVQTQGRSSSSPSSPQTSNVTHLFSPTLNNK